MYAFIFLYLYNSEFQILKWFEIPGWPKSSFVYFCTILRKNSNELFGQLYTTHIVMRVFIFPLLSDVIEMERSEGPIVMKRKARSHDAPTLSNMFTFWNPWRFWQESGWRTSL